MRANARQGGIFVLAGADLSSAPPSAVPDLRQLNEMIVGALCDRLEADPRRPERAPSGSVLRTLIEGRRETQRFPPDYQAQVLEEACGARYFQALQCLRAVTAPSAAHRRIAWLAKHGILRCP